MTKRDPETATAHRAWQDIWAQGTGGSAWARPEPEVDALARTLSGGSALDLGCGIGRHSLVLARRGLSVFALDASRAGVGEARVRCAAAGLRVGFAIGSMLALPLPAAHFDFVLSWNVIYHGDGRAVRRSAREIARVLRPGGLFQGTLLSPRNAHYGRGREIARDTFVEDGAGEKAHPHFYCDAAGAEVLLAGLDLVSLSEREHGEPGSFHWHVVARRRAER